MAESHGNAKGATAHTSAEGGHKAPFPPFQKETFASQLVSLLIAFVALYLIVSRIALPKVGKTIDDRQAKIEGDLAEAQKLKDESDNALKAYEADLAAARSRAQAIGSETRVREATAAEAARKALDAKLSERIAEAEKAIAQAKTAAMANVRGIAAEAATTIVERLIGASPPGQQVADAVAAVLKR